MLKQVIDKALTDTHIAQDGADQHDYYDLNLGPSHPAMHGILENRVKLDGERIMETESHIGYCHRSFEKLAEHYSYNQVLTITDRMNYVSSMANNVGWTLAAEKLLGIEVPKLVQYVRVIALEMNRIMDHLIRVGVLGVDAGAYTGFLYFMEQRERAYKIIEKMTGARLTTTFGRVGGLDKPLYPEFKEDVLEWIAPIPKVLQEFHTLMSRNRIFIERTRDVLRSRRNVHSSTASQVPTFARQVFPMTCAKLNPIPPMKILTLIFRSAPMATSMIATWSACWRWRRA